MRLALFITTFVVCIGVSFAQTIPDRSPFHIDYEHDLSIVRNGLTIYQSMLSRKNNSSFNPVSFTATTTRSIDDINSLDQLAVLPFDVHMNEMSDILNYGLMSASATLLINRDIEDMATIAIMYTEALLTTNSLARFTKVSFDRHRPYNFHYDANLEEKIETNPNNSFFSAHTASAFTNASFITTVFSAYNSESPWKYVVGAGSFGVATTVGILRITSGNHFISDVMIGAAVGTFVGWFIPHMHTIKDYDGPQLLFTSTGNDDLAIQFAFNID